jgi:transcriptional regulator of acetoin/glycerol metabolism
MPTDRIVAAPTAASARWLGYLRALIASDHTVTAAAAAMGVGRATLYRHLDTVPEVN